MVISEAEMEESAYGGRTPSHEPGMDGGNSEDDLGRIQRIRARPPIPLSLLRSTLDLGRSCGLPLQQS